MTENKLDPREFAAFIEARAKAKDGYIMCATGQDPKKLNKWYFDQYADRDKYSAKQEAAARRWLEEAERVWDCQGLSDGYLTEKLGKKINVRAREACADWYGITGDGLIPVEYRVPGASVCMRSSYIHHVGFLIKPVEAGHPEGDWYVGEARGVLYGVVLTKLYERNWNYWGWDTTHFDFSKWSPEEQEIIVSSAPGYGERTLKQGMSGKDVAALQRDLISLNYGLGKWGADGKFGSQTKRAVIAFQHDHNLSEDGIAGPKTFAALMNALPEYEWEDLSDVYGVVEITAPTTWNIRSGPGISHSTMGIARIGETYPAGKETAEGWISIVLDDDIGWVSAKAVKK